MKRRKRMPTRSFFWSVAGRAAASMAQNTVAPLIERLGMTLARKSQRAAARRQGMSLDEITRQLAQDEQDMFDATQTLNGQPVDSAGGSP